MQKGTNSRVLQAGAEYMARAGLEAGEHAADLRRARRRVLQPAQRAAVGHLRYHLALHLGQRAETHVVAELVLLLAHGGGGCGWRGAARVLAEEQLGGW